MNEQAHPPAKVPFRVLVIGGYGVFGSWIVGSLAKAPGFQVTIAGRDLERARLLGRRLSHVGGRGEVHTLRLNAHTPRLTELLREHRFNLVIHAAGPFQGQSYQVARCCIEAGCHYLDLADGRAFVAGITVLDQAASERRVRVISGASSVPGLSSAVVTQLGKDFVTLRSVEVSISPGNRAPRGEATVAAILGYTGRPFRRWEEGRWKTAYGWQDLKRLHFGKLGYRWVAGCDVADLELFPRHFTGLETVSFHAGLELKSLHFAMWLMAGLARLRLIDNWARHAALLTRLSRSFERFGSDRGGMLVRLRGLGPDGNERVRNWRLIAGHGHGPRVPAIPAVVLAKKLARGELGGGAAGPCVGLFSLDEFTRETGTLDIHQSIQP